MVGLRRTALPQVIVTSPSVSLRTLCRTTATAMTSMRNTTVVKSAASRPVPSVHRDAAREAPSRRKIKSELRRARNAKPQAVRMSMKGEVNKGR